MRFSITHSRGFVGSDIHVAVDAAPGEKIAEVEVLLDGETLTDFDPPAATESYQQDFKGVGQAGPGTDHTVTVTATGQDGVAHSSTARWTDTI